MNKLERVDIPIQTLPSGDPLSLTLFRIKSESPGPHIHIQANVHGAELQGNAVIYHLMTYFLNNPFNGSVTFIPMANPQALNSKSGVYTNGRYNTKTGDNWNRNYTDIFSRPKKIIEHDLETFVLSHMDSNWNDIKVAFKRVLHQTLKNIEQFETTYGPNENKKLNLFLQKISAPADVVLDLHTGPIATRYVYSAEYQKEDVIHLNFPFVLHIPHKFAGAMDEATFINWFRLYEAFKANGRTIPLEFNSLTIELGSEETIDLDKALNVCHKITRAGGKLYSFFAPIYSYLTEGDHGVIPTHQAFKCAPYGLHLFSHQEQRQYLIEQGIENPDEIEEILTSINFNRIPNRLYYEDYCRILTESPYTVVSLDEIASNYDIVKEHQHSIKRIRASNPKASNMYTMGIRSILTK